MKNLFYFLTLIFVLVFFSCKPIYKCGESKPAKKLFLPKFMLTVVDERDTLCSKLSKSEAEVVDLKTQNGALTSVNQSIGKRYNDLLSKNNSQTEEYSAAMLKKNDELNAKSEELKQKSEELRLKSEELKLKSMELFDKERLLTDREFALDELKRKMARQDSITNRLNKILRDALLGFKSDELSVEIKNGKVYVSMSDKLLFKSGSATVEAKGVSALKVLADVLNKNTDIDILIEGHTDSIPIKTALYNDNWDLSVARSTSIVRTLTTDYKVPPTRLTASGKGEFSPRSKNSTPEGRASNRRTEIILSPKLDEIMSLIKSTKP